MISMGISIVHILIFIIVISITLSDPLFKRFFLAVSKEDRFAHDGFLNLNGFVFVYMYCIISSVVHTLRASGKIGITTDK